MRKEAYIASLIVLRKFIEGTDQLIVSFLVIQLTCEAFTVSVMRLNGEEYPWVSGVHELLSSAPNIAKHR